jgi:hypothetical protein
VNRVAIVPLVGTAKLTLRCLAGELRFICLLGREILLTRIVIHDHTDFALVITAAEGNEKCALGAVPICEQPGDHFLAFEDLMLPGSWSLPHGIISTRERLQQAAAYGSLRRTRRQVPARTGEASIANHSSMIVLCYRRGCRSSVTIARPSAVRVGACFHA